MERPTKTETVDISSDDYDFESRQISAIYCNAAGYVKAKLRGDAAATSWFVQAGSYLHGDWESVVKTGTDLTGTSPPAMLGVITIP